MPKVLSLSIQSKSKVGCMDNCFHFTYISIKSQRNTPNVCSGCVLKEIRPIRCERKSVGRHFQTNTKGGKHITLVYFHFDILGEKCTRFIINVRKKWDNMDFMIVCTCILVLLTILTKGKYSFTINIEDARLNSHTCQLFKILMGEICVLKISMSF